MRQHVDRVVAPAALGRAVLLGRAAATLTAGAAGLRLVADPRPLLAALAVVAVTTAAGLALLSRHPHVAGRPVPVLAADTAAVLAVLALDGGGVTFYCCAVGAAALAGVLAGCGRCCRPRRTPRSATPSPRPSCPPAPTRGSPASC
ncbi:hypothetical protein OHA72_17410 [Dactylosporangium sp. NBC_01737]|uniref:hypothetical protein n=1 Tax=Dactylosporangium sp. NBC_01737 TaxID=2975959 RepID=UPI002E11292F|nr:hypothetical protein OHA72_17410 [Dactylosporangium sp. NBC_01737]